MNVFFKLYQSCKENTHIAGIICNLFVEILLYVVGLSLFKCKTYTAAVKIGDSNSLLMLEVLQCLYSKKSTSWFNLNVIRA